MVAIIGVSAKVSDSCQCRSGHNSGCPTALCCPIGPGGAIKRHQLIHGAVLVHNKVADTSRAGSQSTAVRPLPSCPRGDVVDNPIRFPAVPAPVIGGLDAVEWSCMFLPVFDNVSPPAVLQAAECIDHCAFGAVVWCGGLTPCTPQDGHSGRRSPPDTV